METDGRRSAHDQRKRSDAGLCKRNGVSVVQRIPGDDQRGCHRRRCNNPRIPFVYKLHEPDEGDLAGNSEKSWRHGILERVKRSDGN